MIIFKMNPLIYCWGPGEGPGGSLGGASSDGGMGGTGPMGGDTGGGGGGGMVGGQANSDSLQADFMGISAEADVALGLAEGLGFFGVVAAFVKGFFPSNAQDAILSNVPILGTILGIVRGAQSATQAQQDALIADLQSVMPELTNEDAATAIANVTTAVTAADNAGDGPSDKIIAGMIDGTITSEDLETIDNGGLPDNATPRDRILHAYKNLGREGIGDRPNQIDQEGLDYWTEQFTNGSVNAETFQGVFDFAAASSDTQRSAISDIPDTIPENLRPGINDYVNRSNDITDIYNQKAESLWDDYLGFEKTYFDEYQGIKDQYKSNLASIPSMNLQLPDTMGGATMPMAPKVHSKMYEDQANTMGHLTESQSQTNLQGIRGRDTLAQNQYTVNQTGLTNSLLPTQTALDLYKMERLGDLGLQQIEARKPDDPSWPSVWAPVAGEFLSSNWGDSTIAENLWDWAKEGLFG